LSNNDATPSPSKAQKTIENDVSQTPVIVVASDEEEQQTKVR
jgi:hypothetical protein